MIMFAQVDVMLTSENSSMYFHKYLSDIAGIFLGLWDAGLAP